VIYCNSAAACTESAADAAIYLILNVFRRFAMSALAARSTDPEKFTIATRTIPAITNNPAGRILGIVGFGRIGLRVSQKASAAFGMKIIYHDLNRKPSAEQVLPGGASFVEQIDELLATADCVVLATPYRGQIIMDRAAFFKMKKGSRFVNIARGKLVDEDGLADALECGQLFAAALDVHFNEPKVNARLASMNNVELQCHIAGGSEESHIGFERMTMENILSYHRTNKPTSAVNMHLIDSKPF
jgi:lactate dehydrogenase-like 2-hydroxyacid dehydrogenase